MLSQQKVLASHAREDQSSPDVFAARDAHWKNVLIGLYGAAHTLASTYLQDERDNALKCADVDHHKAVVSLFNQLARANALGLSAAGAAQLAADGHVKVDIWSVIVEPFSASTLAALLEQNEWLRPGDVVYKADTVRRRVLTAADFAAAPAAIGGAQ